jgi:hypothetical protein
LAAQLALAGQLKAMNSFQEKTSTPPCDSPCAGQAAAGTVEEAAVMDCWQVEPAHPPPWLQSGGCGLAGLL